MFEYVGVKVPPEEMHNKIYFEVVEANSQCKGLFSRGG